jgi:hypothetical protein
MYNSEILGDDGRREMQTQNKRHATSQNGNSTNRNK